MQLDTKMDPEVLKNTIVELKSRAVSYERGISYDIIERCNLIVEVGALTVGTDDTGKTITLNTDTPHQFSQDAVDQIMTINFKNGSGEKILPKVYGRNEWYRCRLDMVNETLELLEKMAS